MEYILKKCSFEERPKLVEFIDKYWKKDHIFVLSKEMLDFQHFNPTNNEYEFAIGVNPETNEIDGVSGIIPLSHYDPELSKYNETWGGIWKTRSDVHNDGIGLLGLELFEFFDKYESHGGFGMSKIAYRFFKRKGYKMCELNQYYILNDSITEFKIAKIPQHIPSKKISSENTVFSIREIDDIEAVDVSTIDNCYWPRKSKRYLINRFMRHPIYKYMFYGIYNGNLLNNILILRKNNIQDHNVLRIVDVYGNLSGIPCLVSEFRKILKLHSSEYIDLMNFGIDDTVFKSIGFEKLDPNGNLIIPNYFEPFEQRNVVLEGAYRSNNPYTFFRADADQDRPNILPKHNI